MVATKIAAIDYDAESVTIWCDMLPRRVLSNSRGVFVVWYNTDLLQKVYTKTCGTPVTVYLCISTIRECVRPVTVYLCIGTIRQCVRPVTVYICIGTMRQCVRPVTVYLCISTIRECVRPVTVYLCIGTTR